MLSMGACKKTEKCFNFRDFVTKCTTIISVSRWPTAAFPLQCSLSSVAGLLLRSPCSARSRQSPAYCCVPLAVLALVSRRPTAAFPLQCSLSSVAGLLLRSPCSARSRQSPAYCCVPLAVLALVSRWPTAAFPLQCSLSSPAC